MQGFFVNTICDGFVLWFEISGNSESLVLDWKYWRFGKMFRVLVVIVVVALSLFLGKCGKGGDYPGGVGEPNDVYYGPPVEEDDANNGYPNDTDDPVAVYYGPPAEGEDVDDDDYGSVDVDPYPVPVYAGPEDE